MDKSQDVTFVYCFKHFKVISWCVRVTESMLFLWRWKHLSPCLWNAPTRSKLMSPRCCYYKKLRGLFAVVRRRLLCKSCPLVKWNKWQNVTFNSWFKHFKVKFWHVSIADFVVNALFLKIPFLLPSLLKEKRVKICPKNVDSTFTLLSFWNVF